MGCSPWLRVGHDLATSLSLSLSCIGEGNGNPLQRSCLENPRVGYHLWGRTQLTQLSSSSSSSSGIDATKPCSRKGPGDDRPDRGGADSGGRREVDGQAQVNCCQGGTCLVVHKAVFRHVVRQMRNSHAWANAQWRTRTWSLKRPLTEGETPRGQGDGHTQSPGRPRRGEG